MKKSEWFQTLLMVAMGLILVLIFASNVTSADEPAPAYEILDDTGKREIRIRENETTGDLEILDDEGKRLYRVRKVNSFKSDRYEVLDNEGKRVTTSVPRYIGDKND